MYLVFHPLGIGLDKVLFDWNSVKKQTEETLNDKQHFGTKLNEEEGPEDKKPAVKDRPLERLSSISSNDDLEDYEESGSENNQVKNERKKYPKKTRKIIHIKFDSEDDEKNKQRM